MPRVEEEERDDDEKIAIFVLLVCSEQVRSRNFTHLSMTYCVFSVV